MASNILDFLCFSVYEDSKDEEVVDSIAKEQEPLMPDNESESGIVTESQSSVDYEQDLRVTCDELHNVR